MFIFGDYHFYSIVSGKSRSYIMQTNLKQRPVGLIPYSTHWTKHSFHLGSSRHPFSKYDYFEHFLYTHKALH